MKTDIIQMIPNNKSNIVMTYSGTKKELMIRRTTKKQKVTAILFLHIEDRLIKTEKKYKIIVKEIKVKK